MTDIVERLREGRTDGTALRWRVTDVHIEAADEIAVLRSVNEALRSELEHVKREAQAQYDENVNRIAAEAKLKERALAVLKPFVAFIEQSDATTIIGARHLAPEAEITDPEIIDLIAPDNQARITTGEMAFGRRGERLPPIEINNGHLRAAHAFEKELKDG